MQIEFSHDIAAVYINRAGGNEQAFCDSEWTRPISQME
jgi:hypothetical protein